MKVRAVVAEFFYADGRTDVHTGRHNEKLC